MNRTISILTFLVMSFALFANTANAAEPTASELQMMYMNILKKNSIVGFVDDDGDIQFTYNDKTYFIDVDAEDPDFFRVVLANLGPIESELERLEVVMALDQVNSKYKVVKAYLNNDNVWMATEIFCVADQHEKHLMRCLQVIESGVSLFVAEMNE